MAADAGRAGSAGQRCALALIAAYKVLLSPLLGGSCRFVPSCSDYASRAVLTHGALKGALLAARRLARCRPFGGTGFDPVPDRSPRPLDGPGLDRTGQVSVRRVTAPAEGFAGQEAR